jgi:DNA invertase Pin-like site-specific DNA recombinase
LILSGLKKGILIDDCGVVITIAEVRISDRSVAHCVRRIQELVGLGIRFLSPTESIDTGAESPMSKFLLHLFAAFAEMEREIIRERVCSTW